MALAKTIVINEEYISSSNAKDTLFKEKAYPNAYIVINKIDGTKDILSICLDAFKDESKSERIWRKFFNFTPSVADSSKNFLQQAYVYLKTLPYFSDAEDC